MVKCPHCSATLPDGAFQCQFCGTQFAAAPAGTQRGFTQPAASRFNDAMPGAPKWVAPVYNLIAAWWIIDGVWTILRGTVLAGKDSGGFFTTVFMIIGGVTALVGIGLLLRIDVVRGIVNVLCLLQILDGALGLIMAFFMTSVFGIWGAIGMIMSAIRIAQAGLMIYLIGETDTRAPNF